MLLQIGGKLTRPTIHCPATTKQILSKAHALNISPVSVRMDDHSLSTSTTNHYQYRRAPRKVVGKWNWSKAATDGAHSHQNRQAIVAVCLFSTTSSSSISKIKNWSRCSCGLCSSLQFSNLTSLIITEREPPFTIFGSHS